jgi:hypothetical protein
VLGPLNIAAMPQLKLLQRTPDPRFQFSSNLAQVRARPLTNYCAWNEPFVPKVESRGTDLKQAEGRIWPAVSAWLVTLAGF